MVGVPLCNLHLFCLEGGTWNRIRVRQDKSTSAGEGPSGEGPASGDLPITTDALRVEPPVSPGQFFSLIDSDMRGLIGISVIRAGITTGIFRELEHSHSISDLSQMLGISEELLAPFCQLLCVMGLLLEKDGRYHNSGLASTYLFEESPYSQVSYLEKISRMVEDIWGHLPDILHKGPVSYTREDFFDRLILPSMAENALTGRLQRTVRAISDLPGFTSFRKMIDLGGGHGLYAIALAGLNPGLEAIVFDLPRVIPLAHDYIRRYNAQRVRTVAGDFFKDEIGEGYDLIFSSSNPSGKSIGLLDKITSALNPGGYFVNVQSDDEGDRDPYSALEWQLWTIGHRPKGKSTFTKEQPFLTPAYRDALASHGLAIISEQKVRDDYHPLATVTMIITRKD
jgi:predicted TPR repeat methyltransferase